MRVAEILIIARSHRNGLRLRLLSVAAIIVLAGSALFIVGSERACAENYGLIVWGYVKDASGDFVDGATVTATVHHTDYSKSRSLDTYAGGYYSITFPGAEWSTTDLLDMLAVKGEAQDEMTDLSLSGLSPAGFKRVDMQFEYAIPGFGSEAGLLLAIGLVAIVASVSLRKKKVSV